MTARGFAHNLRLYLIAGAVVVSFAVVAYRLVELHVLDREHYLSQIQDARHRVVPDPARRGDILDTRGDLLATTRTDITLAIDPWALPENRSPEIRIAQSRLRDRTMRRPRRLG